MPQRRFFDQSQPQTLQAAVLMSYFNAALALLYALVLHGSGLYLLTLIAMAPAAYFVANERKLGYYAAVGLSVIAVGIVVYVLTQVRDFSLVLNLLFAGVLVYLLLHPMSRSYERIYFR